MKTMLSHHLFHLVPQFFRCETDLNLLSPRIFLFVQTGYEIFGEGIDSMD